jgi:hypothetical protein
MADAFTPDAFWDSAREFAAAALDAQADGRFRRVAIEAGTALEHLAKACLASRSPALLIELRGEGAFGSLLTLLGIAGGAGPGQVRTVSLRDALERVQKLVPSTASMSDLLMLAGMRDGTVHAALTDEVEERILAAFVQHCDVLLTDLGVDRAEFWGGRLSVVDALLAEASDRVAHRVAVKLAAARARLAARVAGEDPRLLQLARQLADARNEFEWDAAPAECPVCESLGVATGTREEVYPVVYTETYGERTIFRAQAFTCSICRLCLDSPAEMEAADMQTEYDEG